MKKDKRIQSKKVRRVLNSTLDFFKKASGHKLNSHTWHAGVKPSETRTRTENEDADV